MGGIDNSLKEFDFKIVCPLCFVYEGIPGKYRYSPNTHVCEENVLIVRQRRPNAQWLRVRERTNHRDFPGKYILCHSVLHNNPGLCRYGEGTCSFAHNEAEQHIWGLEKLGKFSITDFILQNRHSVTNRGFTLNELLKKHPGFFTYVCRPCFYGRPPRISEAGFNGFCTAQQHDWEHYKCLAHVNPNTGQVSIIDHRKFTNKGAFFRICKFLHYCQDQIQGTCLSAHGFLERDIWMLERDTDITREEIVKFSQKRRLSTSAAAPAQQQFQHPPPAAQQQQGAWAAGKVAGRPATAPSLHAQTTLPGPQAEAGGGRQSKEKVPYAVQEYCGTCWTNGLKSLQNGNTNRCVKGHTSFNVKRVFLIVPIFKELRALPVTIPRNLAFQICRIIMQKKKCQFEPGPCQFAHSEEERVLWIWMSRNKVTRVEDVVRAYQEETRKSKISQGDSVVAAIPTRATAHQIRLPSDLQNSAHYCRYCSLQCNSERQWDDHCATEKHNFNVNSDKDHQWNFRQPPWGLGNRLDICAKHVDGGRCPYSHVPDMFNLCKYAHSPEELDEWRERFEWRQMKRTLAKEQNMFSYMDQLLDNYNLADSRVTVMSETVAGVQANCKQSLEVFREEKNAVVVWTFIIQTPLTLEKVALLHHNARLHFSLQCNDNTKHQIASGELFEDVDSSGHPCYKVDVHFTGGMFGSFNQWVVFDFGKQPVLLRKLNVELGPKNVQEKVKDLRQKLSFDRWTAENREIIQYQYLYEDFPVELLQRYKEPSSEKVVTQDSIKEMNRHNYIHKMHRMLDLEEITRHKLISSFNLINHAEVLDRMVTESHGTTHCRNGELFLRLPLTENLTEDTGAGKLILYSVRSALLTTTHSQNRQRVYEAVIENKGKDFVFLTLSPVCVRELNMKPGTTVEVEVQFHLNRMHFMKMHYALDSLTNTDIVFPDVTKINPMLNERHTLKVSSKQLNQDQLQAVRHIVAERTGYTPPFIMYGPFGTGKTETLAQAAMVLLRERSDTKILICAQSNSAADLYVMKHLDPYLRKAGATSQNLLLRIVSKERRVNTIPENVRRYCHFTADGSAFEIPPPDHVRQFRVVVTTVEMSLYLRTMHLQGVFSHIFIDEAAQVLECETVMPLTLATDKTCVVLTGDHMQISPKVYSQEARRQNFGMSLLERLFQYYMEFYHQLQTRPSFTPLTIFLSINYRTKMEILRFIAAVFYGGPEKLTACGNVPSVVEITPLLFYAVQGQEVQQADSTSFFNHAETSEIVERIVELVDNWPQEWGRVAPEEIGVVAPYHDQVKQIRYCLKYRRRDLSTVNVETVQNIQGKEFRALFISTVRTRYLLESEHVLKALQEAEAVGDVTDFAFLSDRKLLNTALTRTKSLVAVVGDPVALCAIGECIQEWRTYLKHCCNMHSLHPHNITYEGIRAQVVHLQISPIGRRLKEVTEMCKNPTLFRADLPSSASSTTAPTGNTAAFASGDYGSGKIVYIDDLPADLGAAGDGPFTIPATAPTTSVTAKINGGQNGTRTSSANPLPIPLKSMTKGTKPPAMEDKFTDIAVTPDEILLQLARERLGQPLTEPLKVECLSVQQEGGQAVLSYDTKLANDEKRKKLLQAAAAGREFEDDCLIYEASDPDTRGVRKYYNFTEQALQAALHNSPERYKRCGISVQGDCCSAKVLNPLDSVQDVEIRGVLRRGRAFDRDEVVVEIFSEEEGGGKVQGQVVGVLQRAIDHRCRSFVCTADPSNTGLMTPINPGIPRIYNVVLHKHTQRVKKGFVCVYRLDSDKALTFSHYEKVEPQDVESKLFVVRYLKWLPGFFNPIGIVLGVIPAGRDLGSAVNIVDIEHHLPSQFRAQALQEVQGRYGSGYSLPQEIYAMRQDLTNTWCFTIGSPDTDDLEVAFSIDQMSEVSYQVCVHIIDMDFYLEAGSEVDKEAKQRGSSVFPMGRDPVSMLPSQLSDICSLEPNLDRCALSVILMVGGSGEEWHVIQSTVKQTVVNSKKRFSYQDVEDILGDLEGAEKDYLKSCVLVLFQIALMQRKQRLGNAHLDPKLGPADMDAARGHHMVQELLVMANHQVATKLLTAYPDCTPLLHQVSPNPHKVEQWKSKHAADAINSVSLTRPFLEANKVCTCRMVCMCVFGYMRDQQVKALDHFDVLSPLWEQALSAVPAGYTEVVKRVVATSENHPQSSVALEELDSIIPHQRFVCSGDINISQQGHYTLNLPCYTDITSPLHNYFSIVTQRLLAALVSDKPSPYTAPDISQLAAACNHRLQQVRSYEAANASVNFAAALHARPLTMLPVVQELDGRTTRLHFPNCPYVPETERKVELMALNPCSVPQAVPDTEEVRLSWQERIYDVLASSSSSSRREGVVLCADRFVSHVPPFQWQKLLAAVREENGEKMLATVPSMQEHVHNTLTDGRFAVDVSSEMRRGGVLQHFAEFSLSLHKCAVLQVQLTAEVVRGLLTPCVQLLSLTPTLDVCLQHRRRPAQCFTKSFAIPESASSIPVDEASYQQHWLPILAVEAAEAAVQSRASAVIHNVSIVWSREAGLAADSDDVVSGDFSLGQDFCKERQIVFTGDPAAPHDLAVFGLDKSLAVPYDLLCVRYSGQQLPDSSSSRDKRMAAVFNTGFEAVTWACHCVVVGVGRSKGAVALRVRLLSSVGKIPQLLLDPSVASKLPCTVELIPKTPVFRQMEYGLACLKNASDLTRDVAVGRKPVNTIDQSEISFLTTKMGGQLSKLQKEAAETALKQPFTVIIGPPGSGKTVTAAHLACLFVERNRMTPQTANVFTARAQVLICASTDAALDVLTVCLKSMTQTTPRIVRVYDNEKENADYPVPRSTTPPSRLKVADSGPSAHQQLLQSVTLHHQVRSNANSFSQKIIEFDSLFGLYPQDITDDQVEEYRNILSKAQLQELRQAEIILATCSAAASPRMALGTSVKQIIIDSCESCMEPEALLPAILYRKSQQLVVLGDPNQMQPEVRNAAARTLGLSRSLLERYSDSAFHLTEQYRMHQAISEIPSTHFYQGALKATTKSQLGPAEVDLWPGSRNKPFAFCHVLGNEETFTVATAEEGIIQSFGNVKEADAVASIVNCLVTMWGVAEKSIAVISQFPAQQHIIQQHLATRNLPSVMVNSVPQCQGWEYDYVVLSTCRSIAHSEVEVAPTDDWLERHLGKVADCHQVNVALTRAKKGLIITGNKYLLQSHPMWSVLLENYHKDAAVVDAATFIRDLAQ